MDDKLKNNRLGDDDLEKVVGGTTLEYGDDREDANDWMNLPTHRDNISYDEFRNVSIGVYTDDDGTAYWAFDYGY